MNRIKIITLLLITSLELFFQTSCTKDGMGCQNGSGSTITQERKVTDFTTVNFDIEGTLYITQGTEYFVKVEAQENLMGTIKTEVRGNELHIFPMHCIRHHDPIKVWVTLPSVSGITLGGSGAIYINSKIKSTSLKIALEGSGNISGADSISADDFRCSLDGSGEIELVGGKFNSVAAAITGSGNITLSGAGTDLDASIDGSGEMYCFNLAVKNCDADITGSGTMELRVSDKLDVDISGSGDVYYYGTPIVTTNTSGSGKVIHKP